MYCNILCSIEAAFLEVEKKTKITVATLFPMFTVITPGPFTRSKQSKTFHAKCNLKVYREKKYSNIKSDCMSVRDLKHTVRHICHVVEFFFVIAIRFS